MTIYAIDFGTGAALAIHGPNGPLVKKQLRLPRQPKGAGPKTPAQELTMILRSLMTGQPNIPAGDVVFESATIGSSGCEPDDIVDLLFEVPFNSIYTISNRAVKNYRLDHPELGWKKGPRYVKDGDPAPQEITLEAQEEVHVEDAMIIYTIATETPQRLYKWTGPSCAIERENTSVRPMDKRGYADDRANALIAKLPPYHKLPKELQETLGNTKEYSRSMVMPFALASQEPHIYDGPREDMRRRYEKVIGLYDRGFPSFYRRATIVWMQHNAKTLAAVTKIEEVPPPVRKEAWKLTQRQIRQFFHLTMAHQGR